MISKLLRMSLLVGSISLSSFAAGPSTGGGGDVIRLPDDSVVLADPFLDHKGQQPNNMPPLRSLNPRLLQMAGQYLAILDTFKDSDINKEIVKLTKRDSGLRFYGVRDAAELNMFCASGGRKSYNLPNGAKVEQVACTAGAETFLVEPIFARLSLRQQVLLLIHERLTTLRDEFGGKKYSAIARFTTGLNVYLNILKEQQEKKFRRLQSQEVEALNEFYNGADEINYRNEADPKNAFAYSVHPYGGGRIDRNTQVAESAVISINSRVNESEILEEAMVISQARQTTIQKSFIDRKAQVISSEVNESRIYSGAYILKSVIESSQIGENSQIVSSSVGFSTLGANTKLEDSEVNYVNAGANLQLKKSQIFQFYRNTNRIIDIPPISERFGPTNPLMYTVNIPKGWKPYTVNIQGNQTLQKTEITWEDYESYAPENYVFKTPNASLPFPYYQNRYYSKTDVKGSQKLTTTFDKVLEMTTSFMMEPKRRLFEGDSTMLSNIKVNARLIKVMDKKGLVIVDSQGKFVPAGFRKRIFMAIPTFANLIQGSGVDIFSGNSWYRVQDKDSVFQSASTTLKMASEMFSSIGKVRPAAVAYVNEVVVDFEVVPAN